MGLESVLSDLEGAGYEVEPPLIIPACAVNAPHRRDRIWVIAHTSRPGREEQQPTAFSNNEKYFTGSDFERLTTTEWITKRRLCGTHDGLPQGLDKDLNRQRTKTHGMMGDTSAKKENYHAEEDDSGRNETLRILRERIEAKNIQWKAGGSNEVLIQEILREALFWWDDDKKGRLQNNTPSTSQEVLERFLRGLQYQQRPSGASYRWERNEQQECEYSDVVFILSLEITLEEWAHHTEKTIGMQNLWRACEEIGYVPKTLSEVQALWRSMPYEEKRWCVICAGTGDRFLNLWPGVHPVTDEKVSSRVARLKALGNAVVPQILELIGLAILEHICNRR